MNLAAIDIGGTTIKYAVVTDRGEIHYQSHVPTPKTGKADMLGQLDEVVKQLQGLADVEGIAISSAGQINSQTGTVVYATETIPGYTGMNVKKDLEALTNLRVTVENDVHCAALGEYWQGAAKASKHFLCLTIGTGIGGAIVIDGSLYHGSSYSAGEFGHITLYPNGLPCTCGDEGCYEMYTSSLALERRIADRIGGREVSLPALFEEAKKSDAMIEEVIDSWANDVGAGLKTLIHSFNPDQVVIGGGISAQGEYLISKIRQATYPRVMTSFSKSLRIDIAKHANNANLYGAVYWFLKESNEGA
ncbi:ROK family protein [Alteribacter populi]|uniref:ROK family protein n=1 Tax=Alteribacter populi TaxID=2011011 RepID=UPI0012FE462F|nr:ROK family protein [Alteribacter populi]